MAYDRSWYDTFGMPLPSEFGGGGGSRSTSTSTGESNSSSSSTPTTIDTPENAIMRQISGVASGLAGQMVNWANDVFKNTSRITDQAVGNFFQTSQKMMGLSDNLTDQYNNIFSQQNASLAKEANEYNSEARQKLEMGKAGATQRQSGDAALRSSEDALRSYGINPADGRYAALDKAAAVQNAANTAGAMNHARDTTAQTGRDLRRDAVQVGATMPAAIANVNNTAIQANTGASNASLANANTGANLMSLPDKYLNTAMSLKLPPTGQNSQSKSNSTQQSNSQGAAQQAPHPSSGGGGGGSPSGGGSRGGGGAGPGGGGQGGPAWMPNHGDAQEHGGGRGGVQRQGPAAIMRVPGGGVKGYNGDYDVSGITDAIGGADFSYLNQPNSDYETGQGSTWGDSGYSDQPFNDYGGQGDQAGFDNYDFAQNGWDDTYGGGGDYATQGNQDYGAYDNNQGWSNSDNIGYDAGANAVDTGWDQSYDTPVETDWGGWSGADYSGGAFAKGGPVAPKTQPKIRLPMPRFDGGGQVDPSMSPSGGIQTDDVPASMPNGAPARLNANEFVVPQDVTLWKGQEFFQKLINQSRQARVMAPAPGGQPQQQGM